MARQTKRFFTASKCSPISEFITLLVAWVLITWGLTTAASTPEENDQSDKSNLMIPLRKWSHNGAVGLWGRKRSVAPSQTTSLTFAEEDEEGTSPKFWDGEVKTTAAMSKRPKPKDAWTKLNSLWGKRGVQSSWQVANGLWGRR